jgi:hypothetical protein
MLESAYQFVEEILRMKNYSPLVLGLLTTTFSTTAPVQAVPVAQKPNPPASQQPAASALTLTLQDLPAGFQELPAQIKPLIAAQLDTIKEVLGQQNLQLDNSFSFVNPQPLEVVLGFSTILPNQPLTLLKFDASLQQLQQPNTIQKLQEQLQAIQPGINVVEYKALPDLNNIANSSRGITLVIKMQDLPPLRMEMVGFRRNKVGSFTAVVYLDGAKPVITVKDVAAKLDDRILQSSPAANSSRSTGIRY